MSYSWFNIPTNSKSRWNTKHFPTFSSLITFKYWKQKYSAPKNNLISNFQALTQGIIFHTIKKQYEVHSFFFPPNLTETQWFSLTPERRSASKLPCHTAARWHHSLSTLTRKEQRSLVPFVPKRSYVVFIFPYLGGCAPSKKKTHPLPEEGNLNCTVLTFLSARGQAGSPGAVLGATTDQTHWGFGALSATKPGTYNFTHTHEKKKKKQKKTLTL